MGEHTKHSTSRVELRERIILAAVELFTTNGIKSITMDEIAASLGISKRTLYEVFPDKETLLEECILKSQKDGDIFVKGVIETSSNVLEVLLRCYQWSIERFHATNKKFFEDIKKYPKAYQLMKNNRNRSSELDGKNDNEAPKSRVAERRFAIHDVVCKEKAARACCCRRAKNQSGSDAR